MFPWIPWRYCHPLNSIRGRQHNFLELVLFCLRKLPSTILVPLMGTLAKKIKNECHSNNITFKYLQMQMGKNADRIACSHSNCQNTVRAPLQLEMSVICNHIINQSLSLSSLLCLSHSQGRNWCPEESDVFICAGSGSRAWTRTWVFWLSLGILSTTHYLFSLPVAMNFSQGRGVLTVRKYRPLGEGELVAVLCFAGVHGFGLAERGRDNVWTQPLNWVHLHFTLLLTMILPFSCNWSIIYICI